MAYLWIALFSSNTWCKLNDKGHSLMRNNFSFFGKVLEVPVNVFLLQDVPWIWKGAEPIRHVAKYDINPYVEEDVLLEAIKRGIGAEPDAIVLFLHSYSFISGGREEGFRPRLLEIEKLKKSLEAIKQGGCKLVTFREIEQLRREGKIGSKSTDIIPQISREVGTLKYIAKRVGFKERPSKSSLLLVIACVTAVSVIVVLSIILRARK